MDKESLSLQKLQEAEKDITVKIDCCLSPEEEFRVINRYLEWCAGGEWNPISTSNLFKYKNEVLKLVSEEFKMGADSNKKSPDNTDD